MNEHYRAFIDFGRSLAAERGVNWDMCLNPNGTVVKGHAWNLTKLVNDSPPPTHWIRDFGKDVKALEVLNSMRMEEKSPPLEKKTLSSDWQDFIKAAILEQLFFRRNTTGHVMNNIARPLRVIATCTTKEPWDVRAEDISLSIEVSNKSQASGKLGDLLLSVVKVVFDANHIADVGQLYPALSLLPRTGVRGRRAKFTKSVDELRDSLEERKRAERLPEKRAFWELVRIVFTEQPKGFVDMLRFAQVKIMLLCGLRAGEACLLPVDWKRTRDYYDPSGKSAGELGGYSRSLMLRHFAEKQQTANSNSILLFETAQHIPKMFEDALTETLEQVSIATQPLRDTLRRQLEENRILPWFKKDELVSALEVYTHLTGNPILIERSESEQEKYVARYRLDFDPNIFEEMRDAQLAVADKMQLNRAFYQYFHRMKGKITYRHGNGVAWQEDRYDWSGVYLRIDELEEYISSKLPTKQSDSTSLRLSDGNVVEPWELMFLMPKRALAEGRNDGLCDVTRTCSIGRFDASMMQSSLSGIHASVPSLFMNYGLTDEDRTLSLNTHMLRHLQNTELFRLGIADTIITKRFNRRSVAQSYEYDHRSLAEELEQIELPADVETSLGEKTSTVARLIKSGRANGPIVQNFKEIQRTQGDDAAFEFLKAEADGFHSTPYGHCINSFTVDPCPKHLECFAGCRHLTATNLPENRHNIIMLEGRIKIALSEAEARPTKSIGRENQIKHAQGRLHAVQKLLSTPEGETVFPAGADLSSTGSVYRSVLDDNT